MDNVGELQPTNEQRRGLRFLNPGDQLIIAKDADFEYIELKPVDSKQFGQVELTLMRALDPDEIDSEKEAYVVGSDGIVRKEQVKKLLEEGYFEIGLHIDYEQSDPSELTVNLWLENMPMPTTFTGTFGSFHTKEESGYDTNKAVTRRWKSGQDDQPLNIYMKPDIQMLGNLRANITATQKQGGDTL